MLQRLRVQLIAYVYLLLSGCSGCQQRVLQDGQSSYGVTAGTVDNTCSVETPVSYRQLCHKRATVPQMSKPVPMHHTNTSSSMVLPEQRVATTTFHLSSKLTTPTWLVRRCTSSPAWSLTDFV